MLLIPGILHLLFSKSEVQPWNGAKEETKGQTLIEEKNENDG